jgi:signal transduction histidine kinase
MIELEVAIFTAFGLLLGTVAWWTWKQRLQAEKQASTSAELAGLGREVRGIAHDLSNLLAALGPNLRSAIESHEVESEMLDDVERATEAAQSLLDVIRGKPRDVSAPASIEGIVRFVAALLKREFPEIYVQVDGDLRFIGTDGDALQVVQNLVLNAIREASKIRGGQVQIQLSDGELRITNPVRAPALLDARIYDERVSHSGSSGLGLGIARAAAARIGWTLRHEVRGARVTFVVERARAADAAALH